MSTKINNTTRSEVFTAAWAAFKSSTICFANCLRNAWIQAKAAIEDHKMNLIFARTKKGAKDVAKGFDPSASKGFGSIGLWVRFMSGESTYRSDEAIDVLNRIIAKGGFAANVATTVKSSGRMSEKQGAILKRAC